MRKRLLSMGIMLSMFVTFLSPVTVHATGFPGAHHTTVGDDVFLGGNYIEVGINKYGSFGTQENAPAGFHPVTGVRNNLGLCVDGDGFDVGNASTTGDFFLPGGPFEGYTTGYKNSSGTVTEYSVAARSGITGITNISTTDTSSGDILSATTVGITTDGKLKMTQVVSFNVNDKYFDIHVTYKNISSETLYDTRYERAVDPDQDEDLNGTYDTKNSVTKNPPADNMALAIAKGAYTNDPFVYAALDSRARASVGGNRLNPYDTSVYAADGSTLLSSESTIHTNIEMVYALGDLAPGRTTSLDLINSFDTDINNGLAKISAIKTVNVVNSLSDITVSNGTSKSGIGLPGTVNVTLSDSTTTSAAVTWDDGNPTYDGDIAQTYIFTGTITLPDGVLNPNNYTASINVIVREPVTIDSVNSINDMTVSNGTSKNSIGLAETVDVTLSDLTTTSAGVTWDNGSPTYDGYTAGTYAFTGTITLHNGVTNPNNYTASIIVIVRGEDNPSTTPSAVTIDSINSIDDITVSNRTSKGSIGLPEKAKVILSDGTTARMDVTWNNGTPGYNGKISGKYTFLGVLTLQDGITNPNDYKAKINVIVKASDSTSSSHHSTSANNNATTDNKTKNNTTTVTNKNNTITGWTLGESNTKYYVKVDGTKAKGWTIIDNKWYFFDNKTGNMATGWYQSQSGEWSYNGTDMVGEWFYLDANGKLMIGWYKHSDGNWYYLSDGTDDSSLGVMEKGWKYINNQWYYFNDNGAMASNTEVDGYTLGSDGSLVQQ